MFALHRLREFDPEHLLYASTKLAPGENDTLRLTPLELLDRLRPGAAAAHPPPPCFGVLM